MTTTCPTTDESFTLVNDPPKTKPAEFASEGGTQKLLFAGLDCLAGQQDLFDTDGDANDDQGN